MPEQKEINPRLVELARLTDTPLVVTNDLHYIRKEDAYPTIFCFAFRRVRLWMKRTECASRQTNST